MAQSNALCFCLGSEGTIGGQISVTFGCASSSLVASRLCLVTVRDGDRERIHISRSPVEIKRR
jgi:hypothetical protein